MISGSICGRDHSKLNQVSAGLGTYAGTRLVTLEDGVERGMRVIEMRTGGGLEFDVTVDRSGDIGQLAVNGQVVSWHPPSGLTAPWLMEREGDNGQGFLRGFGGFLNTCGLDHIRQPEADEVEYANADNLVSTKFPLHGKGTFQPSLIRGHGLVDDVDEPFVFCEIEFIQAMTFVSALRLRRRIECPFGSQKIVIKDVVTNIGSNPTTHMILYHFNVGFPMIAPGAHLDLAGDPCIFQSDTRDPMAKFAEPEAGADNFLSVFEHGDDRGKVRLDSPGCDLSLEWNYPAIQLPCCQVLRMSGNGVYGMGIEPCTSGGRSRKDARDRGEMIVLEPLQERLYELELTFANSRIKEG